MYVRDSYIPDKIKLAYWLHFVQILSFILSPGGFATLRASVTRIYVYLAAKHIIQVS